MKNKTQRLTYLGLLTAVSLILFVIEMQLPPICPISGIKAGLANIVTVYAVYRCRAAEAFSVLLARIILGNILSGNPSAFIYSLCGGIVCFAGMLLIKKTVDEKHMVFCSIIGGVLHNLGQTAAAVIIMGSLSPLAYFPFLLLAGCTAGLFTGIIAGIISKRISPKISE